MIKLGDILKVEDISEDPIKEMIDNPLEDIRTEELFHNVIRGDTLYTLANKYNTSIETIREANNLLSNEISIGMILLIPGDQIFLG